ncbi:DUF262 domain-containing protein [Aquimarina litoralis]|uniref:DUF262 domain-containing protein n=1 Tax=Aquimarina litoralis TaxID=584605 RepID=A0ABN1IJ11_9FLAO
MDNKLEVKAIYELEDYEFFIPAYQRGYRWSEKQVEDLLNDIDEFRPKQLESNPDETTWYCLQPIVIKLREDGKYEVIDGQQRLTTIYLILHYLNSVYTEENRGKLFSLSYQTRSNSTQFLKEELNRKVDNNENIDFHHISNAYRFICNWFNKPGFNRNAYESKFKFSAKVIWYESSEEDTIAVFTRLNIGKIPLTNAELIKALFLNSSNFDSSYPEKLRIKQLEISSEWDQIEQTLQDDRFWYFLNANQAKTNRIEFIFELMNDQIDQDDNYSTFRFFNEKFKNKNFSTIENNWLEIKNYQQRFLEWFEERDLYHKIGYLVSIEYLSISEIYEISKDFTKTEFRSYLDDRIKHSLKKVTLEDLQYGDKEIKNVLLLYNILIMLNNENDNSYFPFEIYKTGNWDIEHITSVTDSLPINRQQWLSDAKVFIDITLSNGEELKAEIEDTSYDDDEEFELIYKRMIQHFNTYLPESDVNDISNLTLLDSETNRGYKNAVFPIKRKTIIDREKNGTFIPLGTKNVFLKYFSDYPPKISFWTQEDRDNYYQDLTNVLKDYITI